MNKNILVVYYSQSGQLKNIAENFIAPFLENNCESAVTIQYWMFTGKRDHFLGIFPRPGISQKDINGTKFFGREVMQSLENNNWKNLQEQLVKMKAVEVDTNLMFIESRASALFKIWARTILKKKNRGLWLKIFRYYLLFALFIVAPVALLIYNM